MTSSNTTPLSVAIVGAGPSGFYAAEALLKAGATVALIDRLPAPFGLVRYGVAPDHPKLKQTTLTFAKIAAHPSFHFFGGVDVGSDISVSELQASFNAVIFAHGASTDRRLGIPGEDLPGSHAATEFVGWYNGHPAYRDHVFDLSADSAVVIGNGNVALDVARILVKPVDALRHTDIARHALEQLAESRVRHIAIVGRRGPEHAKFSYKELAELTSIEHCGVECDPADLDPARIPDESAWTPEARRNVTLLRDIAPGMTTASGPGHEASHSCRFHFFRSPRAIYGAARVERIEFANTTPASTFNLTYPGDADRLTSIACGLVFRAVGYRGIPLEGLPFDSERGIVPTLDGRVASAFQDDTARLYATGWIKRGASGIIGTNRADSVAVADTLLRDLAGMTGRDGLTLTRQLLEEKAHRAVSFPDWERIDLAEIEAGGPSGKPREKFTRVEDMMAIVNSVNSVTAPSSITADI